MGRAHTSPLPTMYGGVTELLVVLSPKVSECPGYSAFGLRLLFAPGTKVCHHLQPSCGVRWQAAKEGGKDRRRE